MQKWQSRSRRKAEGFAICRSGKAEAEERRRNLLEPEAETAAEAEEGEAEGFS